MKEGIEVGDTVAVNFYSFYRAQTTLCHSAVVKHIPCATGDSWVFEEDERIHYISEGCTVTKFTGGD